jgi:hypothetical protein
MSTKKEIEAKSKPKEKVGKKAKRGVVDEHDRQREARELM